MDQVWDTPKEGTAYSLVLGDTFHGNVNQQFHTLQYTFKPASVDSKTSGVLRRSENGGLEVETLSKGKSGGNERILFKGNYAPCKEIECILIFDKSNHSFRLERLSGSGKNLKAVRPEKDKRGLSLEPDHTVTEYETEPDNVAASVVSGGSNEADDQVSLPSKKRKLLRGNLKIQKGPSATKDGVMPSPEDVITPPDVMSDEYEHENENENENENANDAGTENASDVDDIDATSMMDLMNQIVSGTQNLNSDDMPIEPANVGVYASEQNTQKTIAPTGQNGTTHDDSSSESSDSDSESGESQSSSASDGDGESESSSESD